LEAEPTWEEAAFRVVSVRDLGKRKLQAQEKKKKASSSYKQEVSRGEGLLRLAKGEKGAGKKTHYIKPSHSQEREKKGNC